MSFKFDADKVPNGCIHDSLILNLKLICDMCRSELKFKNERIFDGSIKRSVLPCKNCLENFTKQQLKEHLEKAYEDFDKVIDDEKANEEAKIKEIEDRVYKKFEKKFEKMMKTD